MCVTLLGEMEKRSLNDISSRLVPEGETGAFQTDPSSQLLALRDKHGQIKSRGGHIHTHAPEKHFCI